MTQLFAIHSLYSLRSGCFAIVALVTLRLLAPASRVRAGGTWTNQSPAPPSARSDHTLAPIGGDQVLLFGGTTAFGVYSGEAWHYDLSANTWTNIAPATAPSARYEHAMAYLGEGKVLLFGGHDYLSVYGDT